MPRETCYRCRRPKEYCLCPKEPPMETRTRIVLLMHPMEWKREKCATGRLTCLNLANSEIIPGLAFGEIPRYRELVEDPANYPVLLYPGPRALNLSEGGFPSGSLGGRRLVVFLIDSTWACARSVLRASPCLLELPQVKFLPREPSRFVIKRQPREYCLSTLEAAHELLLALEAAGLDSYPDKARLLAAFDAMQRLQIEKARVSGRPRYLGMGPSGEA
ncbi:MAG TPA: tRNA-uridine aminocarboxypropyltransferase [Spirochaetia bacterium]|nr:tRNA-uridine aminocarboxypropyltransferase [Spirochaetia bacterium]HRZ64735.1 tRNA-uridine aminocarboxypropyltransferase [Spirochaetia bacterium]